MVLTTGIARADCDDILPTTTTDHPEDSCTYRNIPFSTFTFVNDSLRATWGPEYAVDEMYIAASDNDPRARERMLQLGAELHSDRDHAVRGGRTRSQRHLRWRFQFVPRVLELDAGLLHVFHHNEKGRG